MTVADEEGTDRQTDKLCLADVANEFKKKLWQPHSVQSGQQLSLVFTSP